jgi:hypothetical protein
MQQYVYALTVQRNLVGVKLCRRVDTQLIVLTVVVWCVWLANNPLHKRKKVNKEYVVQGIEGFIDILADEEAWK